MGLSVPELEINGHFRWPCAAGTPRGSSGPSSVPAAQGGDEGDGDSMGPREQGEAGRARWAVCPCCSPAALCRLPAGSVPGLTAGPAGTRCCRAERALRPQSPLCPQQPCVCCLPAESTVPGSSSCGTPTSSCARARPTSAGRTPACGSSSASTSRSLTAAHCRCRSPRTPSSAVSGPPPGPATRVREGAFPSQGHPSFLLVCVCRLWAVLARHTRVTE